MADRRGLQGLDPVLRADGDPGVHEAGRGDPASHDLSSLRLLGSVGEPINPEAWRWYRDVIGGGRTPVVDTWWQTETGQILISPLPGVTTTKPGSPPSGCRASRSTSSTPTGRPSRWAAAGTSSSSGRGRGCSAASTATRSGTSRPTGAVPGDVLRRRRRQARRGGLPVAARPRRRRHERRRAPDLHHRGRVALVDHQSVAEAAVVGKNGPDQRPGDLRLRDPAGWARRRPTRSASSCGSTSPTSSGRSPSRSS